MIGVAERGGVGARAAGAFEAVRIEGGGGIEAFIGGGPLPPSRSSPNAIGALIAKPDDGLNGGGGGLRNGNPALAEPARGGGSRTGAIGEGGAGHRFPLTADAPFTSIMVGV